MAGVGITIPGRGAGNPTGGRGTTGTTETVPTSGKAMTAGGGTKADGCEAKTRTGAGVAPFGPITGLVRGASSASIIASRSFTTAMPSLSATV